jgi:hypothetical protein
MRTYQHPAFPVIDRYDVFYDGHKSDAGFCLGIVFNFYIGMDFASPQCFETCTQPPIQLEAGALCLGVKRPGREVYHSSPFSVEVKEDVEL